MRVLLLCAALAFGSPAFADETILEPMRDYVDFATYDAGIILPAQLSEEIFGAVVFIDTRSAEHFSQGTIPGAQNIEWRTIFGATDQLPTDRKIVLFCNTGSLSAQAGFGLRVAGFENVLILQGGFEAWQREAAYKP